MFKNVLVLFIAIAFVLSCGAPGPKDTIDKFFSLAKEKKLGDVQKLIYQEDYQIYTQVKAKLDELKELDPGQAKTESDKYDIYGKMLKSTKYKIAEEPKEKDSESTVKIILYQNDSEETIDLKLIKKENNWFIRLDSDGTMKDGISQLDRIITNLKEQKEATTANDSTSKSDTELKDTEDSAKNKDNVDKNVDKKDSKSKTKIKKGKTAKKKAVKAKKKKT
ncbi:MAG: hypothetical protein JXA60_09390 [Candidatus Coatesbacteria bacterium]|nr:hypothetical protein [Candidatus Coatesbacteria bacterium]